MLPLGYYNNMIEAAMVMGDVFNFLFQQLDPLNHEILGIVPATVFQKHFTTLFAEFDDSIAFAVLDLIFVFGSGCLRGTLD